MIALLIVSFQRQESSYRKDALIALCPIVCTVMPGLTKELLLSNTDLNQWQLVLYCHGCLSHDCHMTVMVAGSGSQC